MSDTGFPSRPSASPPGLPPLPPGRDPGLRAVIENATGELRDVRRAQRLEGEVVRVNRDGSIRIRTDKGEIDVRLRTADPPAEGDIVEIDIPPGRPPKQAVVREAPPPPQPQQQPAPTPLPPEATARPDRPLPAPVRLTDPVPISQTPPSDSGTPRPALQPGDVVRLIPLPPERLVQITTPKLPEIAQTVLALKTQLDLSQSLSEILQSPKQLATPSLTTTSLTETLSPEKIFPATKPLLVTSALPSANPVSPPMDTKIVASTFTPAANEIQKTILPLTLTTTIFAAVIPPGGTNDVIQILPTSSPLPAEQLIATIRSVISAPTIPSTILTQQPVSMPALPSVAANLPQISSTNTLIRDTQIVAITYPGQTLIAAETQTTTTPVLSTPAVSPAASSVTPAISQDPQTPAPPPLINNLIVTFIPENPDIKTTLDKSAPMAGEIKGIIKPENLPVLSLTVPGKPWPDLFIMQFSGAALPPGTLVSLTPAPGTIVTDEIITAPSLPAGEIPTTPASPFELLSGFRWPALTEAQDIILQQEQIILAQTSSAQTSLSTLATASPAKPAQLPAAALLFLAAVRAGDLSGWLGEKTIDTIRRAGRADIIAKLGRDFAGIKAMDADPASQDWRSLPLPMSWQNDIHKTILHWRHDKGGRDKDENHTDKGTRFLFDLALDRMGPVQLDGLQRGTRLDLIVRSHRPFSSEMQQEMRRLWVHTLETSGLSGELSFQNRPDQFIKIEVPRKGWEMSA